MGLCRVSLVQSSYNAHFTDQGMTAANLTAGNFSARGGRVRICN